MQIGNIGMLYFNDSIEMVRINEIHGFIIGTQKV